MNYKLLVFSFALIIVGTLLPLFLMGDISLNDTRSMIVALILVGVGFGFVLFGIIIAKVFDFTEDAIEQIDQRYSVYDKMKHLFRLALFPVVTISVIGVGILDMPYGYYALVRWTVFLVCLCFGSYLHERGSKLWLLMVFWSLLYNPFVPFYFSREIWLPINLVTIASIFYFLLALLKNTKLANSNKQ